MIETIAKPSKRIFGLDLLRVFSILLVLFSHTSWIYPPNSSWFGRFIDMCGFFGVELFFVLSGFLVGGIIFKQFIREDFSYKTILVFLNRRLIRVLPNYYLVIIINIIIGFFIGFPILESWKYFFFYQNFSSPSLPFFPESWSMPIKEYGYIITVIVLLVFSLVLKEYSRKAVFISVVIGGIFFFFLLKVYYNISTHNTTMLQWNISLRSVAIYRIDSVFTGILAGYVYSEHYSFWRKNKNLLFLIGVFLLAVFFFVLVYLKLRIQDSPFFWNVICLPFTSISLVCFLGFFSEWITAPRYLLKPVELLSRVSYAIYLLHYSIVLFLLKYFIDTSVLNLLQLHLFTVVYFMVTIILSYLLYNYYERPITKLRYKKTENL